jgi:hypothetical protein
MNEQELVNDAVTAIGAGQPDDFRIAPTKHADSLDEKAAALSKILRGSQLSTVAGQYEEKDVAAIEAQTTFRKTAAAANWAVFLTACFSAALLVIPALIPDVNWLILTLGICGSLTGAFAAMSLFKIRQGDLLGAWMRGRARAEAERLKYFELATAENRESSGIPLPLLQLEYFRRYQLDVQRAFYKKRGQDHKRFADQLLTWGAYAVGLSALATGLAGILGGVLNAKWATLAALAAVASALSAFTTAMEAIGQHRRNEELYGKTRDALMDLLGKLDELRAAAATGDQESLKQFVAAVHEQLSLEHAQWLDASENTAHSLAKLDEALEAAKLKALVKAPDSSADSVNIDVSVDVDHR